MKRWLRAILILASVCLIVGYIGHFQQATPAGDETAIEKMISRLGPEGGVVKLPARTYVISRSVELKDNVTIQGAGIDKTVIRIAPNRVRIPEKDWWDHGSYNVAFQTQNYNERETPEGNHDVVIRDLTIDGDAAHNPWIGEGIFLPNCYNYRIERVRVMNCRGFAGIYTSPNHEAARKKIAYKNYIVDCVVEGNRAAADRDAPYGHGIYVTARDNDNILIKGNVVRNNLASGIHLEDFVSYVFVVGNETYNNSHGIWLSEARKSAVKLNKVHDNQIYGIMISQGAGNEQNLISGNEIYRNGYSGVTLSRDYAPGNSCSLIVSNTIKNNNQSKNPGQAGVMIAGSAGGNYIGFNYIYDDQSTPTQDYGIYVASTDNSVVNNYVNGNRLSDCFIAENKNNTFAPWDYDKIWSPDQLATKY